MKTTSDDLYRLIKSLDRTEKGYFRKFAHPAVGDKHRNYIKLFDAIERQAVNGDGYDEKQIKAEHREEKFVHQLSFTKTYLYTMILKALSSYDSGKFIGSQINESMEHTVVLFRRGLYSQCLKLITRTKKIAYKNEQYLKLYDILRYEKNVYVRLGYKEVSKLTQQLFSEQIKILDTLRNITEYGRLYNEAFDSLDEFGRFKGIKDEKAFESIMSNKLMSSDTLAASFTAKMYFYGITNAYYIAKRDFSKVYYLVKKIIEMQNSKPEFKISFPFSYHVEYLNLIEPAIYLEKYGEAGDLLALIERVINDRRNNLSKSNREFFSRRLLTLKLIFYVRNWTPDKVTDLIEEFNKPDKFANVLTNLHLNSVYYFIAQYYFIIQDFDSSLKWLNKIDISFQTDYYLKYYSFVHILNILIHYELGNYDTIEYLVQSMRRFLNKNKQYYELETNS
jgi:hypothetical protein